MPRNVTQQTLKNVLARQELAVRSAFLSFIRDTHSERVQAELARLLERRQIDEVLRILDGYINRMAMVVPKITTAGLEYQVKHISSQIGATTHVAIGFDPTTRRTTDFIQRRTMSFVQGFTGQQREATRDAIVDGLRRGVGTPALVQRVRDSIGLTPQQRVSVQRYTDLLNRNSSQALDRKLRNPKFDALVERAIDNNEPLSAKQIVNMTTAYQRNMLVRRADTIARTTAVTSFNEAQHEVTREVTDRLGIAGDEVTRTWNAVDDERTRDTHAEMDGQERGLNEPFNSSSGAELMYPGDPDAPLAEIVNCRCVLSFSFGRGKSFRLEAA